MKRLFILMMIIIAVCSLVLVIWNPPSWRGEGWPPPGCVDTNPGKGANLVCNETK